MKVGRNWKKSEEIRIKRKEKKKVAKYCREDKTTSEGLEKPPRKKLRINFEQKFEENQMNREENKRDF